MGQNFQKIVGIIIIIFSITGLLASLILSIEKVNRLKDPQIHLSCSINSAFNCVSVMDSPQAELFGFPNSFLGLMGFSFTLIYGVNLLLLKERSKLLDLGFFAGITLAFIFSYWLLFQSAYVIKSLCIYCLLSCLSSTNIYFSLFILLLKDGTIRLEKKFNNIIQMFIEKQYYYYLIGLWYFVVILLILHEMKDMFI
ncbi:MAG: membrane protein [Candidatus Dojkabacteria bacterium]|nr:MAG: membrane protein [Candidatus Dojkabacteria bacterium]